MISTDTYRKGKERKGKERKGKERKGKRRKGKERKGKERKGKERKGKERGHTWLSRPMSMTERLGRSFFFKNPARTYSCSKAVCGRRRK